MKQYTVHSGDTLYGVAKQFGTTVDEIKRLNNLSNNILSQNQVLIIEEDTTTPNTYIVEKGDSLYSIGQKFGISVDELIKDNNLTSNNLNIDQILKVSSNNSSSGEILTVPIYENYTVKKGDNLYSIAQNFNTTAAQIREDNNLTTNDLTIGEVLKIRVGEEMIGIEQCYGEGFQELGNTYVTHTVKKGDNLYTIAQNYNTTVEEIKRLNNLTSNSLTIGEVLKIKEES